MIKLKLPDILVFKAVLIFFISGISNLVLQSLKTVVLKRVGCNPKMSCGEPKRGKHEGDSNLSKRFFLSILKLF